MTRNAIVISPHPAAANTCMEAGMLLSAAATAAGAPDGAIQILDRPSVAVVQDLMADDRTKLMSRPVAQRWSRLLINRVLLRSE